MLKKDAMRAVRGREKAARKKARLEAQERLVQKEQKIQASLAKREEPGRITPDNYIPQDVHQRDRSDFLYFYRQVSSHHPKLICREWAQTFYALYIAATLVDGADLTDWTPKAKSPRAIFQSAARHLLGKKFPQPLFLWTAFEESYTVAVQLAPLVAHIAAGGSLFKAIPGLFPVALTRKQCHELMQTVGMNFVGAVRWQQVKAHGGSLRLARMWSMTPRGSMLGSPREEAFWETVIAFLAKNPMLDLHYVGSLVDYINFRRGVEINFTMKGRTAMALMRDVTDWHQTLHRIKVAGGGMPFTPSGFSPYLSENEHRNKDGNHVQELWVVREILSGKDLAEEGRTLKHCVYSYSQSILNGRTSIWSMCHGPSEKRLERVLTIEVDNRNKRISQARGLSNRPADPEEFKIMNTWAQGNGIRMGTYL